MPKDVKLDVVDERVHLHAIIKIFIHKRAHTYRYA